MTITPPRKKPILISGAGLASLLFARALLRASIPFILFERDPSLSSRAQGYRLRLSSEGLDAIEAVLGPEAFPRFWDACGKTGGVKGGFGAIDALDGGETVDVWDRPATAAGVGRPAREVLASRGGKTVGISRGEMRGLFLEGCEGFVEWGRLVVGYEVIEDGVRAVFQDGTKSIEGELLVAGDGIHSKVAKQVSGGKLKTYDTGARGIHGQAPTTAFKALGEGVWRIIDESRPNGKVTAITNVRPGDMDDPTIMFGWTMTGQPNVIRPPTDTTTTTTTIIGKPAADLAKSLTAHWHPRVRAPFDAMDEAEAAFWKITCSTPSGVPEWVPAPRVTVLGDACHSMTPAGGIGANTALRDAALLGRLLARAGGWYPGVTGAYEREMRGYASEAVRISYGMAAAQLGIHIDEELSPTVG